KSRGRGTSDADAGPFPRPSAPWHGVHRVANSSRACAISDDPADGPPPCSGGASDLLAHAPSTQSASRYLSSPPWCGAPGCPAARVPLHRLLHRGAKLLRVDRLHHVVMDAGAIHRSLDLGHVGESAEEHLHQVRQALPHPLEKLDPGHLRHLLVGDHDREPAPPDPPAPPLPPPPPPPPLPHPP